MAGVRLFAAYLAVVQGVALAIFGLQLLLWAHVAGGPVTVYFNLLGEQFAETVLYALLWPLLAVGYFYAIEHLATQKNES